MADIFISYRRDDTAGWAGRLATDLVKRFGPEAVFQDISAIGAGEDFINAIESMLGSCSAVLVLIGPDWSTIKGKDGNRRLDDPSDTVRLEVAKALEREGVLVIPVLLGAASMPDADDLPAELELLVRRNAFELSDKRWNYDLDQLTESLVNTAGLTPVAEPVTPASSGIRKMPLFAAVTAVLTVLVVIIAYTPFDRRAPEKAFEVFAIDSPVNGQGIPLGEKPTRIVEGRLQVADALRGGSVKPDIKVQVLKLPEGEPVVPQKGTILYSTEQGRWEYITARFAGEGRYKILATITLGEASDFHSVIVNGLPKGDAFRQAIERDREIRGASKLSTVVLDDIQLQERKTELAELQKAFFEVFRRGDLDAAEVNLNRTLELLEPVLPSHPNDWHLQNLSAYTLKNYAMLMRRRGKTSESRRYLIEAQQMFEAIREQNPDDAAAWNGLGSVTLLQGNPERALVYIDRALELNPNYGAAKDDREVAVEMIERKEQRTIDDRP